LCNKGKKERARQTSSAGSKAARRTAMLLDPSFSKRVALVSKPAEVITYTAGSSEQETTRGHATTQHAASFA
jgi:hypothetical protein